MKPFSMFRYYSQAVFIPAVPVVLMLGGVLFSLAYPYKEPVGEDGYELVGLLIGGHAFYFCLAALPILLNGYKAIRINSWLSSLSWLLLPSGLICLLISECFIDDARIGYLFFAGCDLIYMVGLLLAYSKFRREQARHTSSVVTVAA